MRTFATPRGDVWFTRSTPQDRPISGWSWFVTGGIVRTVLLGHCGRFAASSQKRERTQGKQHHREQPGHYHGGSDRGTQYAQLHPDPRGGDDERQRGRLQQGGCQGAPLTYHRPVQGGRNPAGEQQGKKEHGHQRERRPAGEKCSHVELHSAGYEEEWDKDVGVAPVCTRSRSSIEPSAATEKTLRSSLAAFVTNRYWPSLVRVTDPCDWRWGVPSPSPLVATLPMRSSEPSSALRNAISSLGAALVCT